MEKLVGDLLLGSKFVEVKLIFAVVKQRSSGKESAECLRQGPFKLESFQFQSKLENTPPPKKTKKKQQQQQQQKHDNHF